MNKQLLHLLFPAGDLRSAPILDAPSASGQSPLTQATRKLDSFNVFPLLLKVEVRKKGGHFIANLTRMGVEMCISRGRVKIVIVVHAYNPSSG